ncbi:MAG: DUF934 domain-containing protein [Hyphomicrobiales bacterium]
MSTENKTRSVIVRDGKFSESPIEPCRFLGVDELQSLAALGGLYVDLKNDEDPELLVPFFAVIDLIRIAFPSSADGRGFSLGQRLRRLGFKGTLRAHGDLISDQYPMALRTGFNELEISANLAKRQPEEQWLASLPKLETYRARLGLTG